MVPGGWVFAQESRYQKFIEDIIREPRRENKGEGDEHACVECLGEKKEAYP